MSRQARVGLLVFAGLALFMLALFALANRSFLFSDTFVVRSQFSRVSGLQSGASVQFQGVNVGRVESVRLPDEPRGKIVVTMAIQERAQHLVHSNTQAQIKTDGLVGNMIVVLVNPVPTEGAVADGAAIDEGDFIQGVDPFDVFEITDKALASVQRFEESATSFEQIILDIRNGEGTIGKLIYDDALYASLLNTTEETQRLMTNLGNDAEALVALAGQATEGVQDILAKVESGDGTIARLINDPGVYNSLLATADTLQAISTSLRALSSNAENMANWGALGAFRFAELMEAGKHNWLFKRYFEERGYMEKADFEVRERAIAESYRELMERQRELQQWEERLRAQTARIDSLTAGVPPPAPPDDAEDETEAPSESGQNQ
ncbi:MAG: MlaD family protein [Rhodothermales bacterium]|nr:MlaD family protein [Rhodothermales bacterium]